MTEHPSQLPSHAIDQAPLICLCLQRGRPEKSADLTSQGFISGVEDVRGHKISLCPCSLRTHSRKGRGEEQKLDFSWHWAAKGHMQCSVPGPKIRVVNKRPLGTQLRRSAFLLRLLGMKPQVQSCRESTEKLVACVDGQCFPSCRFPSALFCLNLFCAGQCIPRVTHSNLHMAVGCGANPSPPKSAPPLPLGAKSSGLFCFLLLRVKK